MTVHVDAQTTEVKYEGKIDLSIKNNSHTLAYDFIEIDSLGASCKILEVGCSTGYFGQALKNAGHIVWGIEMTPDAAELAKKVLDFVYVGTIEAFLASEFASSNQFDYIVFGDVLEHLSYPETVLEQCKSILTPNGGIVASIPNVAHLAVRVMLLEGRWEYSALGIMDNTHLRFFDKKSIINMFNKSGYAVQSLDCVRISVEQTGIKVDQKLYESASKLVHDDAQDVFQYVVLTKPVQSPVDAIEKTNFYLNDAIKVLCILPNTDSALAKIRIIDPLRIWAKQYNGLLRIRQIDRFNGIDDVAWADVVVLQREANVEVIALIHFLKKLKKKIIFDIDDLLTQVPSFLTTYKHALRTKKKLEKALQICDAVTVTNQCLKNELIRFNVNIVVIPNCSSMIRNNISQNENERGINLIIANTDTIRVDFMIPVLKKIIQQTEIKFNLIGIGPPGKFIENAGIKIELHENMPHEAFKQFLTLQKNAVGLIPLDDSKFSSCKSAIKFIDFSLSGVVSICSNVPPYTDTLINGTTGILVNNDVDSWYNAIIELGKSKTLRVDLAKAAKDYCLENFALDKSAEAWQKLMLSLNISQQKVSTGYFLRQYRLYRLNQIISHIFDKNSFLLAIELLKKYGVIDFTKRFFRYLSRK